MRKKPLLPDSAAQQSILYSFGPVGQEANPYVNLLLNEISEKADIHYFSWKFALFGTYDVFHVHWPETLIRRRTFLGRYACRLGLAALLMRLYVLRVPIVRTEHNLQPHEHGTKIERLLLRLIDMRTAMWIVMNELPSHHPNDRLIHIPHGHYRDWYRSPGALSKLTGKILSFGLLRPYKGLESLIGAFKLVSPAHGFSLSIMGKPNNEETAVELTRLIGNDSAITTDFRHVPDDSLVEAITQAELVVLPYKALHNSGALLLALSLNTPVLVPSNAVTEALAAEVGDGWVQRFEGALSPAALIRAAEAVRNLAGIPDLSKREWPKLAAQHLTAYQKAQQIRRQAR